MFEEAAHLSCACLPVARDHDTALVVVRDTCSDRMQGLLRRPPEVNKIISRIEALDPGMTSPARQRDRAG